MTLATGCLVCAAIRLAIVHKDSFRCTTYLPVGAGPL
ncbi:Uncharacterised protein [Acinetobacter baumannii]|nr:Uncharacterised protein [Acinetobacter baumannii]